jgi:methionyl-tRNA formyltransferase
MRILFLGSGPFGIPALRRLHSLCDDLVVGTVPDAPRGRQRKPAPCPLKEVALELGIPIFESERLKGSAGRQFLEDTGAQLVITADIRLILGRSFLQSVPLGCFNLHGSILPRWRGAAPIVRALLTGDEEIGVSLYRMVPALDAGPVVAIHRWRPPAQVTAEEAEEVLSERAADLLAEHLEALRSGQPPLADQDDAEATLAPKVDKAEGWIDWQQPAHHIDRQIRALQPWPRTRSLWKPADSTQEEEILILHQGTVEESSTTDLPGTVTDVSPEGILVACGEGSLRLGRLQRSGKKPLPAADFLRGLPMKPGDRLISQTPPEKGDPSS